MLMSLGNSNTKLSNGKTIEEHALDCVNSVHYKYGDDYWVTKLTDKYLSMRVARMAKEAEDANIS